MKSSEKWMLAAVLSALGIVGFCLICIVGAVLTPLRWWSHGGATEAAEDFLRKNPVVTAHLGTIRSFGALPSGSQSLINGEGKAHLLITIRGEKGEGTAEVDLMKRPGESWKVTAAVLVAGDQRLVLEAGPGASSPSPPSEAQPGSDEDQGVEPRDV